MATIEQLSAALIKADAAGNADDARAFAAEIRKMQAAPVAAPAVVPTGEPVSRLEKIGRGMEDPLGQAAKQAPGVALFGALRGLQDFKQDALNALAGGVRGAGSIGSTIIDALDRFGGLSRKPGEPSLGGLLRGERVTDKVAPSGGLTELVVGKKPQTDWDAERRASMDDALKRLSAEPDSWMYKGGKLGGEIAGTAGAGTMLANGMRAVPLLAKAGPLIDAVRTGGMSAGGMSGWSGLGVRAAGGAITGAASAGAVNPEDALTGAAIGGALPGVVKVAGETGKSIGRATSGLAKNALGMTTGAGAETFGAAYRAGKQGGTSFLDNMRGNVPMTDVLDSAKDAMSRMRIERGNQYRSGMVDIAKDKSVINFAPIDDAVNSLKTMGSFKGQVINKNAAGTVDEITDLVSQWKSLDPKEYHTPEGLDALKKAIGDIRDATQFGTPGRKAADTAYNAVKAQIDLQAPTYAKVMKDYSQASDALTEIEKSLSLGNKAAADTSMRKLQSLMRNNVNTNYGNRLNLAKTLEDKGADILPAVAGQAASSFTPRGLQGLAASGAGVAGLMNPAALAALPFTSPRLMGELSYGLGAMNRGIGGAAGKVGSQLLGRSQRGLLDVEQFAPFLSTAPVIAFSQR